MSRISFFQRFKQAENHATNNTLLVLRYFYENSPKKIERIINSLLDIDSVIGLSFDQQIRSSVSIPDALILQQPLRIFFETKRGGTIDLEQIRRHFVSISASGSTSDDILVALTKEPITIEHTKALTAEGLSHSVRFAAITFSDLLDALKFQSADYEPELRAIIDDYEACLIENGLYNEDHKWMPIFPCGTSIVENTRFSLYYEPASRRSKTTYRYIGIYNQKAVRFVGRIASICSVTFHGSTPQFSLEAGELMEEHRARIISAIESTSYYNLSKAPIRFYVADKLGETLCRKSSSGGIQGLRYLDLSSLIAAYDPRRTYSSLELAQALDGTTWE